MNFFEEKNTRFFFDGAMGTMLQALGLKPGEATALWNRTHPDLVRQVHEEYLKAGCNIINANTFTANPVNFPAEGEAADLVKRGVAIAKEAASAYPGAMVTLDVGPLGRMLAPFGEMTVEEAYSAFKTVMVAGEEAGADFVMIETMTDLGETKAAVLAAKENTSLPVAATVTLHQNGRLLTGGDVAATVTLLEGLGTDAIGFNCSLGPREMTEFLKEAETICTVPLICTPNAGLPELEDGKAVYRITPEEYAAEMYEMAQNGAFLLGGCCGTTPIHMKAMIERCKALPLPTVYNMGLTAASSRKEAVYFGGSTNIIGNLFSPANEEYVAALLAEDYDYIFDEAESQQDDGAHLLSISAAVEGIDEEFALEKAVMAAQSGCSLPLIIESANKIALERAVRSYAGKPVLSFVDCGESSQDRVFPLIKKYGGVALCLPVEENGTVIDRIAAAKKIIAAADRYGIERRHLLFDLMLPAGKNDGEFKKAYAFFEKLREWDIEAVAGATAVKNGRVLREEIAEEYLRQLFIEELSGCYIDSNTGLLADFPLTEL